MAQRIELLKKELQQHEEDSLSEFGSFSVPMDLTDERRATVEEFEPLDVHEMLLRLAFTSRAPDKIALHKTAWRRETNTSSRRCPASPMPMNVER